jgi:ATP-dependent exoDNAse (exonuclease V) beta subunit
LLARVRAADAAGRVARECPILWRAPDGSLVDGTADLIVEEADGFTVFDFKTDRDPADLKVQYERQLGQYVTAVAALRGRPAKGVLVRV